MRSVRRHADRLGLDYSHFTGQRRWTDPQLADAVAASHSWTEVADRIGLVGGSSMTTLRGHAARLDISTEHLNSQSRRHEESSPELHPDPRCLRRAGPMMAAAWFTLCGTDVAWPLEPARYDLLVWLNGKAARVQVKTATVRSGSSWTAWLSTTGRSRATYDPEEIDYFFIIDGSLTYYLIPVSAVGGLHAIQLSAYTNHRVGSASSLSEVT